VGPLLVHEEEVTRTPIRLPKRALAMAATLAGLLAIGFAARTYIVGSAATEGSGQVSDGSEVTAAPSEGPDQFFVFNDQMAAARDRAADRDWAGVREAVGVAFAGLTAAESFVRDSLLANASLELARMASQGAAQRTTFFVNVFEHTSRALAAVPPFAPGTDAMRLMQAEACLEGSLDCDSGGVVENLVLAGRSSSARIRGRATDLLARTSPVSHDAAVLVSNDGGPGRL
jgi:hypothetical protein